MRPPGSDLIRSSKPSERLSINILGTKPMTRSKNQYLLTEVEGFNRFPSTFPLRNITFSSVIKFRPFLRSSKPPGSFTLTGHTVRVIGIPKLVPLNWNSDFQNYALPSSRQSPKQALLRKCVEGRSVPVILPNHPLSDWECVTPSTFSSTWTLINTVTMESPHDRFFCFKCGELLLRPSRRTLAQDRHSRVPPEIRKGKIPSSSCT